MNTKSINLTGKVRDIHDAREASAEHFAKLQEQAKSGAPMVGSRRYPRTGQRTSSSSIKGHASRCASHVIPGGGRVGRPECDTPAPCHGDVLGWHSLGATDFPIAGGAGTIATNATQLVVNSGNANAFKPRELFFEARDSTSNFAVIPGMLVAANISGTEQLVGDDSSAAITSSVFALTNEPLPVSWDAFSTVGANTLKLTFGNYLAVGVTAHFFGVFWGDEV